MFVDLNSIYHFMKAYQSVFVSIRFNPRNIYHIGVLKIFKKYINLGLNPKELARLKNDIDNIAVISKEQKECLKEELNVCIEFKSFNEVDKLKRYNYVLKIITDEMLKILERKEYERVYDFADAVHNFPEFLVTDFWSAEKYYDIYIKPYNKKWNDTCLNELKSRNKVKAFLLRLLHRN